MGLKRHFKGLIRRLKGLIRPLKGLIRPVKGLAVHSWAEEFLYAAISTFIILPDYRECL